MGHKRDAPGTKIALKRAGFTIGQPTGRTGPGKRRWPMRTKEAFKQKMEAEVARAQADLERYTALGMGFTGAAKNKHDEHVEALEQKLDETKARLRELGEAEEPVWEELRDGVMSSWRALQSATERCHRGV